MFRILNQQSVEFICNAVDNTVVRFSGNRRQSSTGVTLIEVLVGFGILGILLGLVIPTTLTVFNVTNDFRMRRQLQQIAAGVDSFHARFGIYPPDNYFERERRSENWPRWVDPERSNLETLLIQRYGHVLQIIAPNHREFDRSLSSRINGEMPIVAWYRARGQYLNPGNPLSFWLGGGLNQDNQYPLSYELKRDLESDQEYQQRMENSQNHVFCKMENTSNDDPLGYWQIKDQNLKTLPIADPTWVSRTNSSSAAQSDQWTYNQNVPAILRTPLQIGTNTPILYFSSGTGTTRDEDGYLNSAMLPYRYGPKGPTPQRTQNGEVIYSRGDIKGIGDEGSSVAPVFTFKIAPNNPPLGYLLNEFIGDYQLITAGADGEFGKQSLKDPATAVLGFADNLCNFSGFGRAENAPPFVN